MRITLTHLLTMSSGISWPQTATGENASNDMGKSADWVQFIVDRPIATEPGSVTNYSNGDSHLLAAVLQTVTKTSALEFAQRHLFTPLGIKDVAWNKDPQGRDIGSAALQMRPIDMAKFGMLVSAGWRVRGASHRGFQVGANITNGSCQDADPRWSRRLWLLLVALSPRCWPSASSNLSLVHILAVAADGMSRNFEPKRKQVEAWPAYMTVLIVKRRARRLDLH